MTNKTDFTAEEWNQIVSAPIYAGAGRYCRLYRPRHFDAHVYPAGGYLSLLSTCKYQNTYQNGSTAVAADPLS